jgi:dihydrodipicolinate synthase/N-acetylneuraminate lyase
MPETNMESQTKLPQLRGVFSPTITAYHPDGSINPAGTRRFVRFLLDEGVDGLAPLGSAGEPVALTAAERMKVLDAIVEEVGGKIPIFAGTSDYSTASTIELGLHAKSIGCDGLMLMAPFLLRPPKKDVLDYFRRIRERVGLPIMIYNVPSLSGIEVRPDEIRVLASEDVVHSVKWSHTEISRIQDTRFLCGPKFPIFAGIDLVAFGALAAGADGWISGIPMIAPALAVRVHRLLCDQKLNEARELWYRILPIIHIEYRAMGTDHSNPHWLAVCRESAALRGLDVGISRPPLQPVEDSVREELRAALQKLKQL